MTSQARLEHSRHCDPCPDPAVERSDPPIRIDGTGGTSPGRRRLESTLLTASVIVASTTFATCVLAFLPGSSLVTLPATMLIPTFAPLLFVGASAALVVLIWCRGRIAPRLATCSAVVAALSATLAIVIIASMVSAIGRAGGSVNVAASLFPKVGMAGQPDSSVTYATVGGVDLHASIYEPQERLDRPAPTLVYVHGGGWISGRPDEFGAKLRWFADQGWLVIGVEYRLSTTRLHTWDQSPADIGCALSWTGANAGRFGGDASRVIVMGDSAGGNLAINASYAAATGKAESSCGGTVPVPLAVVAQYPVVDPVATWNHGFGGGTESGARSMLEQYLGGTPAEYPQRYAAVSSGGFVDSSAPPTLIIEPARDHLIPSTSVDEFVDLARGAGVDVDRTTVPFADHGYDSLAIGSIGDQGHRTIVKDYVLGVLDPD